MKRKKSKISFTAAAIFAFAFVNCHGQDRQVIEAPELVIQNGHSSNVQALCFSPDGKLIASGSADNTLKLWNANSGQLLRTFEGHSAGVYSLAFSPDGQKIVSGSWDHSIKLWDIVSGQFLNTLTGHSFCVSSVNFSPDGKRIVSGSWDYTVKLWDAASGQLLRTFEGYSGEGLVRVMIDSVMNRDDEKNAGGYNKIMNRLQQNLGAHSDQVICVNFSPDGKRVASGSKDKTIKLWDVASGQLLRTIDGHSGGINSVSFSPDGKMVASGSWDKTAKLWDAVSGRLIRTIEIDSSGGIISAAFSPDGQKIALGCWNHYGMLWNLSGQFIRTLEYFDEVEYSEGEFVKYGYSAGAYLSFSSDSKKIVSGGMDGEIRLWNVDSGQLLRVIKGRFLEITFISFSPDGQKLAVGSLADNVILWDAASGQFRVHKIGNYSFVTSVSFSPDGQKIITGNGNKSVTLLDAASGQFIRTLGEYSSSGSSDVKPAIFSPDGQIIASGSDETIKLWHADSGQLLRVLEGKTSVYSISFSPDGQKIVAGGNKNITIWDTVSGKLIRTLERDSAYKAYDVTPVSFSPDGKTIASGSSADVAKSDNNFVKLWDAVSGRHIRSLKGHTSYIESVNFSPDGKIIASGSFDHTVKLWDISSGQLIRTLIGHSDQIRSVCFSPDGKIIASASSEGTIKFWNVNTGQLLATVAVLHDRESMALNNGWVVFSPEGFFDGTRSAWQLVPFRFPSAPLQLYEPEQFFNQFYQPGLLTDLLQEGKSIRDILQARGDRRARLDIAAYKNSNLPEIRILAAAPDSLWRRTINVEIEAKDTGSGLRDLRVFRNQSLVHFEHGDLPTNATSKIYRLSIPVKLVGGQNEISAYCFNNADLKSKEANVKVMGPSYLPDRRKAHIVASGINEDASNKYYDNASVKFIRYDRRIAHIVAIGINEYADSKYNLKYAVPDAQAIADTLSHRMGLLGNYTAPVLLLDQNATKANILAAFSSLSNKSEASTKGPKYLRTKTHVNPEDVVIVYFAGHGMAEGDRYYLIPHDISETGNRDALLARSISDQELEKYFEKIDASHIILIIDACQSGQALEAEEKRRGPMNSRGLAQLAYEKGMYILAASQNYQAALEFDKLGHGLLTYVLVQEGLAKMQADYLPANGEITAREWLDYAVQRVPVENQAAVERFMRNLIPIGAARNQIINSQLPRVYYRQEAETQPLVLWKR